MNTRPHCAHVRAWLVLMLPLAACAPRHPMPAAPDPTTFRTVAQARTALAEDHVASVIVDGIFRPRELLDSLPPAEVVSVILVDIADCLDGGTRSCKGAVVQFCGGAPASQLDEKRRVAAGCPWQLPDRTARSR